MQENKQEKSPIKQNILLYLEKKGITQYEFYKQTGVTRGVLGQNNGISEDNLTKFLAYYKDVNIEWLLTGKGNMLKEQERQNSSLINTESLNIERTPTVKQLPIGEIPHIPAAIPFAEAARNGLNPIPLVTTRVAAGFGGADFTIEEADIKDYYVIPKFKNCHVDFMIEITGLSM